MDTEEQVSFEDLGLDEYTLKAVEKKGFVTPSPIQVLAIPRLLDGDANLIARARTGTGKTAAFGLPIIQSIREKSSNVQALILEPTRELAMQTCEEMKSFSNDEFPRTCVLYGGASYSTQIKDLKRGSEIVVGTPGRIKDHIEKKTLDLSKIKYFILDEGDEMLDMGFIDDIEEIFRHANPDCRILLFSATMPAPILKIAGDFMGDYDIIEEEKVIDEALLIEQKYWTVKENEKIEALVRLIDISPDFYGIVFTMTKSDADRVTRELDMKGYEAAALHGDIMQNQREKVIERFKLKKTKILVATDVAARGIDISGLTHVVNYSLPFDTATYVHRIGRTGRAGTTGIAVSFVRPEERRKLGFLSKNILKATKNELKEGKIPTVNEVLSVKEKRIINELKEKLFIQNNSTDKENEQITTEMLNQVQHDTNLQVQNDSNVQVQNDKKTQIQYEINSQIESDKNLEVQSDTKSQTENEQKSQNEEKSCEKVLNPQLLSNRFEQFAKELTQNQDSQKVLEAVLSILYGEKLSSKHYGRINTKEIGPKGDSLRIFVSLGKKDGYRAKEIADYFSNLLHIPGRMVDDIDVAQQFSLVSLPVSSAKKAIELSKQNHKIPHMHIDIKEDGRGSRRQKSFERNFEQSDRNEKKSKKSYDSKSSNGRPKGNRPNVHTQTNRSSKKTGGAAIYKKSGNKERF